MNDTGRQDLLDQLPQIIAEAVALFRETCGPGPIMFCDDDLLSVETTAGPLMHDFSTHHVDEAFGIYASQVAPYRVEHRDVTHWGSWSASLPNTFLDVVPEFSADILVEWARDRVKASQDLIVFHCHSEDDAVLLKLSLREQKPSEPRFIL